MIIFLFFLSLLNIYSQTPNATEKVFDYPEFRECGLVTKYASNKIPPQCLTESLNVVYDEDLALTRRKGSSLYNYTPCEGQQKIRGLWYFKAVDGTKYMVIYSSQSLYYSKGDGKCSLINPLITGLNPDAELECVQSLGRLYCTNGIDTPFWWDGTSTGSISGMPKGTLIGTFRNRIITAGMPGELSRVRLSGEGDGTDWTLVIPGHSTSPASIDISGTNDGMRITCLMGEYQNAYFIGRENELYALYGYDRRDFTLRKISSEIGCIEPRSVKEKNGCLYWLSKRGLERMCGTNIERVSDPIKSEIEAIIRAGGNIRTKTYNTEADFETGLWSTEGPMSTTIYPGSIVPSTWSYYDNTFSAGTLGVYTTNYYMGLTGGNVLMLDGENFNDGDYTNGILWNARNGTDWYVISGELKFSQTSNSSLQTLFYSFVNGKWRFKLLNYGGLNSRNVNICFQSYYAGYIQNSYCVNSYNFNDLKLVYYDANGYPGSNYCEVIAPSSVYPLIIEVERDGTNLKLTANVDAPGFSPVTCTMQDIYNSDWSRFYYFNLINTSGIGDVRIDNIQCYGQVSDGGFHTCASAAEISYISPVLDTNYLHPVGGIFNSSFTAQYYRYPPYDQPSFYIRYSTSPTGVWSNWISISTGAQINAPERYWQYKIYVQTDSWSDIVSVKDVSLDATTTGYYILDCAETTKVSSWKNFRPVSIVDGNAKIDYYVVSGNSCNEVTRSTANWTYQIPNSVISVATAPYLGTKISFTPTTTTETIRFDALTIEWNEGEKRPPVASEVYNDRYWLFYTTSTTSGAHNDHALILDSSDKWSMFDNINAYSSVVYENNLYTGDSIDTGFIRQQEIGVDDSGSPFTFKIKTNDFDFGNPIELKLLKRIYLLLKSEEMPGQNINLTLKYYIDGSTTPYTISGVNLSEAPEKGYFVAKFPVPVGLPSSFHWLKLGIEYTGNQGPVSIIGIKVVYSPIRWE